MHPTPGRCLRVEQEIVLHSVLLFWGEIEGLSQHKGTFPTLNMLFLVITAVLAACSGCSKCKTEVGPHPRFSHFQVRNVPKEPVWLVATQSPCLGSSDVHMHRAELPCSCANEDVFIGFHSPDWSVPARSEAVQSKAPIRFGGRVGYTGTPTPGSSLLVSADGAEL